LLKSTVLLYHTTIHQMEDVLPTKWHITTSTKEAWQTMLKMCESAKDSIYMEQFLFEPDQYGREFLDIFIKKSKEGVTVKLIFDSLYSRGLSQSLYIDALQHAGVKVKFFNWILPFSKHNKKLLYFRNHRRLLIVDRKVMFTGGICIHKKMESWRETCIKISGPVVDQSVAVFDKTWRQVYKKHSLRLGTQSKTGMDGFSYITHAPLLGERYLYRRLIEAIRQSEKTIYITTPYFLPDRRLERVLCLAARRGVDVNILMPKISNHPLVDIGAHTFFEKLLEKGIKIHRYKEMIHAKTVCIDNDWGMIGTMNLDNISLRYNFESGLIINQAVCLEELRSVFIKDLRNSERLSMHEWQKRSILQRLKERLIWPIRKFL
jgi:cardiolipin synthase A/B